MNRDRVERLTAQIADAKRTNAEFPNEWLTRRIAAMSEELESERAVMFALADLRLRYPTSLDDYRRHAADYLRTRISDTSGARCAQDVTRWERDRAHRAAMQSRAAARSRTTFRTEDGQ